MKVEIKEQPQQVERKYPYVGKSIVDGNIVLFVFKGTGLSLIHKNLGKGFFSDCWNEKDFTPLPPNSVTITI